MEFGNSARFINICKFVAIRNKNLQGLGLYPSSSVKIRGICGKQSILNLEIPPTFITDPFFGLSHEDILNVLMYYGFRCKSLIATNARI